MDENDRAELARMGVRVSIEARQIRRQRPGYLSYAVVAYWILEPGRAPVCLGAHTNVDAYLVRLLRARAAVEQPMAVSA